MAWTGQEIRQWVKRENLSGLVAEHAEELAASGGLQAITPEWLSQHGVRMLAPRQKIFAAVRCVLVPGTKVCRFGEREIKQYEAEEEVEEEGPAQRPQSDHNEEALALVGRRDEEDDEDEDENEDEDEDEATQECESQLLEQVDLIQSEPRQQVPPEANCAIIQMELQSLPQPHQANSPSPTSRSLPQGPAPRVCTKIVSIPKKASRGSSYLRCSSASRLNWRCYTCRDVKQHQLLHSAPRVGTTWQHVMCVGRRPKPLISSHCTTLRFCKGPLSFDALGFQDRANRGYLGLCKDIMRLPLEPPG